ncbi:MAG TPA: DUF3145 family protein [Aquiluna sp.]
MARIWVLSASTSQRQAVNNLFAVVGLRPAWQPQPHQPTTFQAVIEANLDASNLASDLARIACPFEIDCIGERFLFHPGLGILRQQLDDAGEPVIRMGQLRQQVLESGGNMAELERRLRLIEGLAWLDLLEPYRLGAIRYSAMPRAV